MNCMLRKLLTMGMLALAVASCTHFHEHVEPHPLNGKLWDASAQRFIEPDTLAQQASAARFVLLGEIHDNKTHHAIQARLLSQIAQNGNRPALVMEQFDRDQQRKLDDILKSDASQDDKLKALHELMRKGWDWPLYEPLLRLALQYGLPVVAANLSREELRIVSRQGFAALGAGEEERLALERVWTPQRQARLVKDIYDGHCGKVPQHVVDAIAKAQRARDAVMADTMLKFAEQGAVAIVGSGHARRDMAVPLYLAARAPQATLLSLGMVQLDTVQNPAAYANGPFGPVFDVVWFTPRVRRGADPCDTIPSQPNLPPAQPAQPGVTQPGVKQPS